VFPAPLRVVLDANVLFPFSLRDTLLRAAERGLFQLYWSQEILAEARRNLVGSGQVREEQAARLFSMMADAFPEAMVTGHEALVPVMKNDPKDRHVVAAAIKAGAQVIVTNNLRDFQDLPDGVEVQSADQFLCNLYDLAPDVMVDLLAAQAAALRKPARSLDELMTGLAKLAPEFVELVNGHRR
jgi:predicted nucleic acid-binding protein